jgi:pimeloyl-ACP methyl ester carboxylesterase
MPSNSCGGVVETDSSANELCQGDHHRCGMALEMLTEAEALLEAGLEVADRAWARFQRYLGWGAAEIDRFVCHQVGRSHQRQLVERLGLDPARDYTTYETLGNVGSVSLPITLRPRGGVGRGPARGPGRPLRDRKRLEQHDDGGPGVSRPLPDWLRKRYPFSQHGFAQPGGNQNYLDEGGGHPVLMIHGNPTWSFFYREVVQAVVARGGRAIAPDHLGCGLSDKPLDWTYRLADHVANLRRLVDALEIERFSLLVHDWGGAIGMGLATSMPERVARIGVLNTAAFRSRRMPFRIGVCRWPIVGEWIVRGLNGFAGPATKMTTVKPLAADLQRAYLWPYDSWAHRVAIARFVQDIPMGPSHPSYETLVGIENGLERLGDVPMHIAWGAQDWCFNRSFFEEWRRRFPEATHDWREDAGHYVLEDGGPELHRQLAEHLVR